MSDFNQQDAMIEILADDDVDRLELLTGLAAYGGAWDWGICTRHLRTGSDLLRYWLTIAIATRVDYWRDKDRESGMSLEGIERHAKPGIDLLVRIANFDPDAAVRAAALMALDHIGHVAGCASVILVSIGQPGDVEYLIRANMIDGFYQGQQN